MQARGGSVVWADVNTVQVVVLQQYNKTVAVYHLPSLTVLAGKHPPL
mgnify:CR=1